MLEDNVAANIFIEPNGGDVTDEDSGEEDGGGFLNNLSEQALSDEERMVEDDLASYLRQQTAVSDESEKCRNIRWRNWGNNINRILQCVILTKLVISTGVR